MCSHQAVGSAKNRVPVHTQEWLSLTQSRAGHGDQSWYSISPCFYASNNKFKSNSFRKWTSWTYISVIKVKLPEVTETISGKSLFVYFEFFQFGFRPIWLHRGGGVQYVTFTVTSHLGMITFGEINGMITFTQLHWHITTFCCVILIILISKLNCWWNLLM